MKNTLIAIWRTVSEMVIGGIFVVACLATGAALLTTIFGGGYSLKIGPKFYDLPNSAFDTLMVALLLWAVFAVLYLIRIICRKYAKNR